MSNGSPSRMRWLIAGTFSPTPVGRVFPVSGERFTNVLGRCRVALEVEVPDALGDQPTRRFELAFERPRDFRIEDVIAGQSTLGALRDVATALVRARDPISRRGAAERIRSLVGDGELARALEEAESSAVSPKAQTTVRPPTPKPDPASGGTDSAIDAIFAKAEAPGTDAAEDRHALSAARSGVDAFIGALRSDRRPTRPAATNQDTARVVSAAVERSALDLLGHPRVAPLEQAWRGLRMLLAESPGHDDLAIEALDVELAGLADALDQRLSAATPEMRPDAVFVTHGVDDVDIATGLAEIGDRHRVAIVIGVPPTTCGATIDADGWPSTGTGFAWPEAWSRLREHPASAWLLAAANPIVVANEPLASGSRLVSADPAFGVATLLTAALARSASLGTAIGRAGAVSAPAAQDLEVRGLGTVTVPTQWPASLDAQRCAAEIGLALFGHERDRVLLAAAPMMCSSVEGQLLSCIQRAHQARTSGSR